MSNAKKCTPVISTSRHVWPKSYCGQAHLLPPTDWRIQRMRKDLRKKGMDETEVWSLCDTIALFCAPRLRMLALQSSHPGDMTLEEWQAILEEMAVAMELVSRDNGAHQWSSDEEVAVDRGLSLFTEHFLSLWC